MIKTAARPTRSRRAFFLILLHCISRRPTLQRQQNLLSAWCVGFWSPQLSSLEQLYKRRACSSIPDLRPLISRPDAKREPRPHQLPSPRRQHLQLLTARVATETSSRKRRLEPRFRVSSIAKQLVSLKCPHIRATAVGAATAPRNHLSIRATTTGNYTNLVVNCRLPASSLLQRSGADTGN